MSSTTVYLIRHGESQANKKDVFLGHYDLDLTETGKKQADETARYLKKNTTPSVIYSSDLLRAYNTAKATSELIGIPITADDRLREIRAGDWENVPFSVLREKYAGSYGVWVSDIDRARCDGGESVKELQARITEEITRLCLMHKGESILIFTHATPIRAFAAFCKGGLYAPIKDVPWAPNASITKVSFNDGCFTLLQYGECGFMGDLVTKLPNNV